MTLSNEQIQAILDGAPEGATHYAADDGKDGAYVMSNSSGFHNWYPEDGWEWEYRDEWFKVTNSLSDLREILTLRQELEIHKRHTKLIGELTEYMVKHGIGYVGECSTTEIVRVYEESHQQVDRLKAQQSEVAARAVEDVSKVIPAPNCSCEAWLHNYANQLREQGNE